MRVRRSLVPVLLVALLVANIGTTACVHLGGGANPHPNQINAFDGKVFDALLVANGSIEQAKGDYKAGKFKAIPNAMEIINAAATAYNSASASYKMWRDVMTFQAGGDVTAARAKLDADMLALNNAILQIAKLGGRS